MLRLYEGEALEEQATSLLTCRRCGRLFPGGEHWHPICHSCWRALRWLHQSR